MHLKISVPNNHQYKWRKNDHLSYTALSSAKTGLKLHYSSKHPVSAHSEVNHPFVCRNDHPLQLFITNSNRSNIKLLLLTFKEAIKKLCSSPNGPYKKKLICFACFTVYQSSCSLFVQISILPISKPSKFNYKAYNPLI